MKGNTVTGHLYSVYVARHWLVAECKVEILNKILPHHSASGMCGGGMDHQYSLKAMQVDRREIFSRLHSWQLHKKGLNRFMSRLEQVSLQVNMSAFKDAQKLKMPRA